MKFHIMATGCQMNLSDTERLKHVLLSSGFSESTEEDADLLGVVACSVRQKAIDKITNRIHIWNRKKKKTSLITFLTGCVLPEDREKFLSLFDLVFDIRDASQLPEMLRQYGLVSPSQKRNETRLDDFWNIIPEYQSSFEAYIPIQNGCDNYCSYCAVPYTRGREMSRPSDEIEEEFLSLLKQGYKSITLLGQNVNSYGWDKPGEEMNFAELLDRLGNEGEKAGSHFWLYFTAPHPKDMTRQVVEAMARHRNIARQVHLPLQSGDDEILQRMNRRYTVAEYGKIVQDIREILPDVSLFTDIIVGFPGETEAQFVNTAKAMEKFSYSMAFIARYSPRPGAVSARMEDDISPEIKRERNDRLSVIVKKTAFQENQKWIGKTLPVLVYGSARKPGYMAGLTEGKVNIQFPSEDLTLAGQFVRVLVSRGESLSLEGSLIEEH